MQNSKPLISRTRHPLHFDDLSPEEFERLCLWLVEREGYDSPQHLGLTGDDGGWDVLAEKAEGAKSELWCFQCKRWQKINAEALRKEVRKIHRHAQSTVARQPVGICFVTSCRVSPRTRAAVEKTCNEVGYACSWWAKTELDMLVNKHPELVAHFFHETEPRNIEGPILDYSGLVRRCAMQVEKEIKQNVGAKYVPALFVRREMQRALDRFADCDESAEYHRRLVESLKRDTRDALPADCRSDYFAALAGRSPLEKTATRLRKERDACDLIGLQALLKHLKPLLVVVDRAGAGKTNMLCDLATELSTRCPVVFVAAGPLSLSDESSLTQYIERSLHLRGRRGRANCSLHDACKIASASRTHFVIIIDAINENPDWNMIRTNVSHLLSLDTSGALRVVVSCRDLFWNPTLEARWKSTTSIVFHGSLYRYTDAEWDLAIGKYLGHYRLCTEIVSRARGACENPLMLRFFCEAYGDPEAEAPIVLPIQRHIRLTKLFGDYYEKKREGIRERLSLSDTEPIDRILEETVRAMVRARSRYLPFSKIQKYEPDFAKLTSVFSSILDEDIILKRGSDRPGARPRVAFVYDEFMQYLIARVLFSDLAERELSNAACSEALLDICRTHQDFEPLLGALRYMLVMIRDDAQIPLDTLDGFHHPDAQSALLDCLVEPGFERFHDDVLNLLLRWMPSEEFAASFAGKMVDAFVDLRVDRGHPFWSACVACLNAPAYDEAWLQQCESACEHIALMTPEELRPQATAVLFADFLNWSPHPQENLAIPLRFVNPCWGRTQAASIVHHLQKCVSTYCEIGSVHARDLKPVADLMLLILDESPPDSRDSLIEAGLTCVTGQREAAVFGVLVAQAILGERPYDSGYLVRLACNEIGCRVAAPPLLCEAVLDWLDAMVGVRPLEALEIAYTVLERYRSQGWETARSEISKRGMEHVSMMVTIGEEPNQGIRHVDFVRCLELFIGDTVSELRNPDFAFRWPILQFFDVDRTTEIALQADCMSNLLTRANVVLSGDYERLAMSATTSHDVEVQAAAAYALGYCRTPRSFDLLLELRSEYESVHYEIHNSLEARNWYMRDKGHDQN